MGSLILCHKKRAKQPYMITRVHIRIYTIEELCYYICNNLYLIDYTLMNRQLCEWIREELHMWELADQLLGQMEKKLYCRAVCAYYFGKVECLFTG